MLLITSLPEHRQIDAQARAARGKMLRRFLGLRPFTARHLPKERDVTA